MQGNQIMYQQNVVITTPNGIHTRPAARLVEYAKSFESYITITSKDKSSNAKRFFGLQTLDLSKGCSLTITAEGVDEKKAVDQLVDFIKNL
jgi:Phosphotransferase System HPr (HPr) Family